MAQQYYEYVNYKDEHVHEQKKLPKGACHKYIIVFHSVFQIIFNVSRLPCGCLWSGTLPLKLISFLSPLHQLSFVFAEFPMLFVLNDYLDNNQHILFGVKACGIRHNTHIPAGAINYIFC